MQIKLVFPVLLLAFTTHLLSAAEDTLPGAALHAADDERVAAIVAADPARLDAIFSNELRYAHSSGGVDTKKSYIDSLVSGRLKYQVYNYQERNFDFPSPGIALMTGRVKVQTTSTSGPSESVLGFLAVWRQENGKWRFLAWQSCKLPAPPTKSK